MVIKTASLMPEVLAIVRDKHTEQPGSGAYNSLKAQGSYLCRQCGLALFRSQAKFDSHCGWPNFDATITDAVKEVLDADGSRQEIICARCEAHLGHVFRGEQLTEKNTRHCVNSLSIEFVSNENLDDSEEAIFAGGCFWGVEALFKQLPGVLKTEVGYTGGELSYPDYKTVCAGSSGHYEAVRVVYNPDELSYETLAKYFFEIHNPTQPDGQGPDRGTQYLSAVFYYDNKQKKIVWDLIEQLEALNYAIATSVQPVSIFWPAEDYHQDYYQKNQKAPYCHRYEQKFPTDD